MQLRRQASPTISIAVFPLIEPQDPDVPGITNGVNNTLSKQACIDFAKRILNAGKITISPRRKLLVNNLRLDKSKYTRVQNDHPENWVHYLNGEEGITVDAMLDDGCEEVNKFTRTA